MHAGQDWQSWQSSFVARGGGGRDGKAATDKAQTRDERSRQYYMVVIQEANINSNFICKLHLSAHVAFQNLETGFRCPGAPKVLLEKVWFTLAFVPSAVSLVS